MAKKRPTDALKVEQREIGIQDTARIQVKTLNVIKQIFEMRMMEWRKTKIGYKPSLNDVKNEIYKRGCEVVLMNEYPAEGWTRDVYKTTTVTAAELRKLLKKKSEKSNLIVDVGMSAPRVPQEPIQESQPTRVFDADDDDGDF